jgi:hypothetical protein
MIPLWLHHLSICYLALGALCAVVIIVELARHPQRMWIMNVVWPTTALFGTVWVLWLYFAYGRLASGQKARAAGARDDVSPHKKMTPHAVMVATSALHCGSGCALGDICAEWLVFAVPAVATSLGWRTIFPDRIFATWIADYFFAYAFGIFFQYFTIAPMRSLSFWQGIIAAIKADTFSLTAWQIGMYGFMAIAYLIVFRVALDARLETDSAEFWFMMQIAMLCGFMTSYPVNWWLIEQGIKEKM